MKITTRRRARSFKMMMISSLTMLIALRNSVKCQDTDSEGEYSLRRSFHHPHPSFERQDPRQEMVTIPLSVLSDLHGMLMDYKSRCSQPPLPQLPVTQAISAPPASLAVSPRSTSHPQIPIPATPQTSGTTA